MIEDGGLRQEDIFRIIRMQNDGNFNPLSLSGGFTYQMLQNNRNGNAYFSNPNQNMNSNTGSSIINQEMTEREREKKREQLKQIVNRGDINIQSQNQSNTGNINQRTGNVQGSQRRSTNQLFQSNNNNNNGNGNGNGTTSNSNSNLNNEQRQENQNQYPFRKNSSGHNRK